MIALGSSAVVIVVSSSVSTEITLAMLIGGFLLVDIVLVDWVKAGEEFCEGGVAGILVVVGVWFDLSFGVVMLL